MRAVNNSSQSTTLLGFSDLQKYLENRNSSINPQPAADKKIFNRFEPVKPASTATADASGDIPRFQKSSQCLAIIVNVARFFLIHDMAENQAEEMETRRIFNIAWPQYFILGGTASSLYDSLRLEAYNHFPANFFRTRLQELCWKLERDNAVKQALDLWWALANSYTPDSFNQRLIAHAVNTALSKNSNKPEYESILFQFSKNALEKLTGMSDDLAGYARKRLIESASQSYATTIGKRNMPNSFIALSRTMAGILEKRADVLLTNDPRKATELLFLTLCCSVLDKAGQHRLSGKTVIAYRKCPADRSRVGEDLLKFCINRELQAQGILAQMP